MPRKARLKATGTTSYYLITSHTIWTANEKDKFFTYYEKEELISILRRLVGLYLIKIASYAIMGNHYHIVVKAEDERNYSEEEIWKRVEAYYRGKPRPSGGIEYWRKRLSDISELQKSLNEIYARWWNKRHGRKGHLWRERFHSLILEKGEAVLQAMTYVELNPIRAGQANALADYPHISYTERLRKRGWLLCLKEIGVEGITGLSSYKQYLEQWGMEEKEGKGRLRKKEGRFKEMARAWKHMLYGIAYGGKGYVEELLSNWSKGRRTRKAVQVPGLGLWSGKVRGE